MSLEEIKRCFSSELTKTDTNPRSRRYSWELKDTVLSAMRSHGLGVTDGTRTPGVRGIAQKNIKAEQSFHGNFLLSLLPQGGPGDTSRGIVCIIQSE